MTTTGRETPAAHRRPERTPAGRDRSGGGIVDLRCALVIGLLLLVVPFIWMLLGSFKTTGELRQVPPTWLPEQWTLENYSDLFSRQNFLRFFFNSTVVAIFVTVGNLLFCSMLGYALAKLEFPGKRILFVVVLGR